MARARCARKIASRQHLVSHAIPDEPQRLVNAQTLNADNFDSPDANISQPPYRQTLLFLPLNAGPFHRRLQQLKVVQLVAVLHNVALNLASHRPRHKVLG